MWPIVNESVRVTVLGGLAVLIVGVPLWILLINSAKPLGEAQQLGLGLPTRWMIAENYTEVIEATKAGRGFINSVIVTAASSAGLLLFASLAAWVFARAKARSVRLLYYVAIVGIILPTALVSTILLFQGIGIYGGHRGLIVLYLGSYMSFAVFLITGFVKSIPIELEDAARVDGAGPIAVFFRIILPLLRPVLISTTVILSVFIWNDFFYPFFFLSGEAERTLPMGLYEVASSARYQTNWHLVFADVVVVSAPLLAFFFFAQRRILDAFLGSGLRG